MHFKPEVAYKYSIARIKTERLWQESIDTLDDSIATAAAGALLFVLYGSDGGESLCVAYHNVDDVD